MGKEQMKAAKYADQILMHYIGLCYKRATGQYMDSDMKSELSNLVTNVIEEACTPLTERIQELERDVCALGAAVDRIEAAIEKEA